MQQRLKPSASGGEAAPAQPTPRVLLVDHGPEDLLAVEAVLQPLGYLVVAVGSSREALRQLRDQDFSVIIVDVGLPGLEGFKTAQRIKGSEHTRHIPIIFLTSSAEPKHFARGYEIGAIDYVYKPFDPHTLRSKVAVLAELWRRGVVISRQRRELETRLRQLERAHEKLARQAGELEESNSALQELARTATNERDLITAVLAKAGELLGVALEPGRAVDAALDVVVPEIADWATVHLAGDDGDLALAGVRHAQTGSEAVVVDLVARLRNRAKDSFAPLVAFRTGQPRALRPSVGGNRPSAVSEVAGGAGVAVPLVGRQGPVGAPTLGRRRRSPYSPAEVALVAEVGRRAGLGVDTAQQFVRERDIASALQHRLLPPKVPSIDGLDTAAAYQAGTAGAAIGGDWYDVIDLGDQRVAITVGDVMGHGPDAAAIMGQVRAGLRSYALDGYSPAAVMQRMANLVQSLGVDLVTSCYTELSLADGTALTVAAGHPPPLLVGGGEARYLPVAQDIALGAHTGWTYEEQTTVLSVGTALVFYSDGLIEVPRETIDLGLERLRGAAATGPASAQGLLDHILRQLGPAIYDHDDLIVLVAVPTHPHGHRLATRRLASERSSVRSACHWANSLLATWAVPEDTAYLVAMALDELVTNAVAHSVGPATVTLGRDGAVVRVEVFDPSEAAPRPQPVDLDGTGGRGLQIVAAVSSRWGASSHPDGGKTVWCEFDV